MGWSLSGKHRIVYAKVRQKRHWKEKAPSVSCVLLGGGFIIITMRFRTVRGPKQLPTFFMSVEKTLLWLWTIFQNSSIVENLSDIPRINYPCTESNFYTKWHPRSFNIRQCETIWLQLILYIWSLMRSRTKLRHRKQCQIIFIATIDRSKTWKWKCFWCCHNKSDHW